MNFLLDPNVSYLILVGGLVMAVLAMFAPGTGLLEIGATMAIVVAGYTLANIPFNWWALVILVVGVFPFLIALRRSRNLIFLVVSIIAMITGSIFMFRADDGRMAVNPALAVIVSVLVAGFMWIIATRGMDALKMKPYSRTGNLINQIGKARSDIFHSGTVYIQSEEWSARSSVPISTGTLVKIIRKDGMILDVEPLSEADLHSDL
jgi:membrane-bound serine protease (ClpP class)